MLEVLLRGLRCERLRWTYPEVPEPRGVERPTFEDIGGIVEKGRK